MIVPFLTLGAAAALVVWILTRRRLGAWAKLLASLGSLLLIMLLSLVSIEGPVMLGGEPWYNRSPWREILLLVVLLAGMAIRSLDEAIEQRRQVILELRKHGKKGKPKLQLDFWDFSRPFLVSIATFGGLLSQIGSQQLGWATLVLAFQTGFFWQTVLKKSPE